MNTTSPPRYLGTATQLGELLRDKRKSMKLTQSHIAARIGLSQNRVSHLEQHADEISFKQLLAWCAALGLELQLGERQQSAHNLEW